jgi:hypothetical protein
VGAAAAVRVLAVVVSAWLGLGVSSPRHHSVLPYDGTTPTTLDGTITGVLWQNPHALIRLDVSTDSGALERWTVESEGSSELARLGWTTEAITAGMRIRTTGARARDGRHRLRCRTITLPDGRALPCFRQSGAAPVRD